MKHKNLTLALIAVAALLALRFMIRNATVAHGSAPPAVQPRTITLQEFTEFQGNRSLVATYTHGVRSDGSEVLIERHTHPATTEPVGVLKKLALANGQMIFFNPAAGTKSTFELGHIANIYMPKRDPSSRCRLGLNGERIEASVAAYTEESLGSLLTAKVVSRHGELALTQWFSLQHGCEMVKQVVVSGKGGVVSQQEVLSMSMGEPPAELFDVPISAMESKPTLGALAP